MDLRLLVGMEKHAVDPEILTELVAQGVVGKRGMDGKD